MEECVCMHEVKKKRYTEMYREKHAVFAYYSMWFVAV